MNAERLENLHQKHYSLMLCYALKNSRTLDEATDAVDEAFVRVAARIDVVFPGGESAYWHRAVTNVLIEGFRRRKRVEWLSLDESPESFTKETTWDFPSNDAPLHREIEAQELRADVRCFVDELSPNHRRVIELHYFEQLEVVEIAAQMGVAEGTVKSRLARARAHLRPKLEILL